MSLALAATRPAAAAPLIAAADKPWLSVIMPTHCGERCIEAALRSIAAEATDGIEILLLDSSPTAATVDAARSYAGILDLHIHQRCDPPTWHAKTNRGVALASAEHICWLHQDDVWLPGRAEAVRQWIDAAPAAPLHLAPSAIIDRHGRTLGVWRCPLPARQLPPAAVTEHLLVQNFIAAPAPVFRKSAWLAAGGMDERLWYTADWDVWLKLAAASGAIYHDEPTTGFRIHDGSQTAIGSRDQADFLAQMQTVLERYLPHCRDRRVARAARASVAVNAALAAAASGDRRALWPAAWQVARLGPSGLRRYWRDSRIVERLVPRVRARLQGAF